MTQMQNLKAMAQENGCEYYAICTQTGELYFCNGNMVKRLRNGNIWSADMQSIFVGSVSNGIFAKLVKVEGKVSIKRLLHYPC